MADNSAERGENGKTKIWISQRTKKDFLMK